MNKIWFKKKIYGWGWYPATWEGWLTTVIYIVAVLFFSSTVDDNSSKKELAFSFFFPIFFLTVTLLKISYLKGEKPGWSWGRKKK